MKVWKGGAILLTVLLMSLLNHTTVSAQTDERALDGVYIDNVNISGMTEAEAMAAVQATIEERLDDSITFTMENNSFTLTAEDLGYTWLQSEDLIRSAVSYGKSGNIIGW